MSRGSKFAMGLDFGTESVRALIVDLNGNQVGAATVKYPHGQIIDVLPGTQKQLPADFALQHPQDWIDASAKAVKRARRQAGIEARQIIGIGVDFTSCTMLPTKRDGTPLCMLSRYAKQPLAWPKLWKHHAAQKQTDRINEVARKRKESFLNRHGGIIGLEWFFPKILETLEKAPSIYQATEVWLEAGDWYVWQLTGGDADTLPRSTCQAGYKGMWSATDGFPSRRFLKAVNRDLADVVSDKMPGRFVAPGQIAGELTPDMAKRMGLVAGIPVSAAIIDAHAGVPGAGAAEPGTLVMVLGTSSCHMLNAERDPFIPGTSGVVADGILPGYFGYETGQAAVGDAFDWLRRTVGHKNFDQLGPAAANLPPGTDGVMCLDWMNGCRTPLMDGSVKGAFTGLTLSTTPAHLYRALLEASAYGVRWIVELLEKGKVPVDRFIATGGLPHHNPLVVQVYADVLGKPVLIHPSKQGPALGAAILGVLAAGKPASGFGSAGAAIRAMAGTKRGVKGREAIVVRPKKANAKAYDHGYRAYHELAEFVRTRS